MSKKLPKSEKFKPFSGVMHPELLNRLEARVKQDGCSKSALISKAVEAWLNGNTSISGVNPSPGMDTSLQEEMMQRISKLEEMMQRISKLEETIKTGNIITAISGNTGNSNQIEVSKTPEVIESHTSIPVKIEPVIVEGSEPVTPVKTRSGGTRPSSIPIDEKLHAEITAHVKGLNESGMINARIVEAAGLKRGALTYLLKPIGKKRQMTIMPDELAALMAVRPAPMNEMV
jgi:hypothetical protein